MSTAQPGEPHRDAVPPRLIDGAAAEQSLYAAGQHVDFTPTEFDRLLEAERDEDAFQDASGDIGQVIALCSNRLWVERKKEQPDPRILEFWDHIDVEASKARQNLYSMSRDERIQVGAEYRQRYAQLKDRAV